MSGQCGRVVNVRRAEPDEWDVYIGRAVARARDPRARVGSIWGNPFRAGHAGVRSAEEAVELYKNRVRALLQHGGLGGVGDGEADMPAMAWRRALEKLRGKRLGCWCHPDPCHGQALLELLDEFTALGWAGSPA